MTDGLRDQIAATLPEAFASWLTDQWAVGTDASAEEERAQREAFQGGAEWAAGLVVPQPPNPPQSAEDACGKWMKSLGPELSNPIAIRAAAFKAGWAARDIAGAGGARGERVTPELARDGEKRTAVTLTDEAWSYVRDSLDAFRRHDCAESDGDYELRHGGSQLRDALAEIVRQTAGSLVPADPEEPAK